MRSGSMPSEHLSSKLPGWSHNWDYGVEMPYIQLKPSSLAWTGSDGAVNTGKTDTQFFEGGVSSGIFKGPASGGATPGYTFSLWIKPSQGVFTTVAGEKVGMIIYTWDPGEAFWYRVEDGKFAFEINSNASAAFDWQARTKKGNLLKPDRWYHVAVTRDPGARQAPRIYLNGKRLEIESKAAYAGASSGAGVPRNYAGSNFYIGRWGSSPTVMFNVNPGDKTKETKKNFVGRVTQWMLFGAQLSERDIYTIYGASLGASERKSGNLDIIPQRERLFIRDNKTGSYPTIQRSGIDNRHGNYRSFYDDRNTIIFKKHKDVFPGEIDKINKGFTKDDIIGWWRMQNLMRQANSGNWRGRTKINTIRFNDVSDNMVGNKTDIPGVTGQRGSSALNTNFQCLIDSGPNNLTGSYHGQATFTTDPKRDVTVHMTTASRGPFPKPDADDIALMSPDQLSRWGGRKSVMLLQTGSKPAFITFKDNVVPRMRLIRDLPNNVKRDKPWTLSMWVNLKHKLTESAGAEQRLQYHGLFRIENNAGAITRARLRHDRNTGNWQIKWWVYGVNTEPTSSTAIGAVETNAFIENGLKPTIPARTGS
ncbi:MAG: LamG-like jellyroll fold domain-containing protein, partial [Actinomycetota bacterium]|nr:LamG-like jellyroll fold domain-containing protein [Actinomycetota bacterium]